MRESKIKKQTMFTGGQNMKLLGMAGKAVLSLIAAIYFFSDGFLMAAAMFFIIYGLLSYYVWYFKKKGFSFSVWVGEKGLLMTLLSLALTLFAPIIILSIATLALNSFLPRGIGTTIGGLAIIILCFGFLARDVVTIIQHFNPSFKLPFLADKGNNN